MSCPDSDYLFFFLLKKRKDSTVSQSCIVKGIAIENVRKPKRCSWSMRLKISPIQNEEQKQSSDSRFVKEVRTEERTNRISWVLVAVFLFSITNEWQHLRHLKIVAHALWQPVDFKWMCSQMTFVLSFQWRKLKVLFSKKNKKSFV